MDFDGLCLVHVCVRVRVVHTPTDQGTDTLRKLTGLALSSL